MQFGANGLGGISGDDNNRGAARLVRGFRDAAQERFAFELDGLPSEPGRVRVEVRDANGETALTERMVYERPEVRLERLPAIFQLDEQPGHDPQRVAELEQLIGRQAYELEILKKASRLLAGPPARNGRSS